MKHINRMLTVMILCCFIITGCGKQADSDNSAEDTPDSSNEENEIIEINWEEEPKEYKYDVSNISTDETFIKIIEGDIIPDSILMYRYGCLGGSKYETSSSETIEDLIEAYRMIKVERAYYQKEDEVYIEINGYSSGWFFIVDGLRVNVNLSVEEGMHYDLSNTENL